jgi:hypothetical protein
MSPWRNRFQLIKGFVQLRGGVREVHPILKTQLSSRQLQICLVNEPIAGCA